MPAFRHFAGTAYLGVALFFYNFQLQVGKPMESCLIEYSVKTVNLTPLVNPITLFDVSLYFLINFLDTSLKRSNSNLARDVSVGFGCLPYC